MRFAISPFGFDNLRFMIKRDPEDWSRAELTYSTSKADIEKHYFECRGVSALCIKSLLSSGSPLRLVLVIDDTLCACYSWLIRPKKWFSPFGCRQSALQERPGGLVPRRAQLSARGRTPRVGARKRGVRPAGDFPHEVRYWFDSVLRRSFRHWNACVTISGERDSSADRS